MWDRRCLTPEETLPLRGGRLTFGDYGRLGDNDLWALLTWMAAGVDWDGRDASGPISSKVMIIECFFPDSIIDQV